MKQGFARGQKQLDAAATAAVLKLVRKFEEMLGVGSTLPAIAPPTIVWKSAMGARALGRHIVQGSEIRAIAMGKPAASLDSVMELQRIILTSESTLARVVAHEAIHHVESGLMTEGQARQHLAGYRDRDRGHGTFFRASAKKINDLVGDPTFVTVTSDDSYELAKASEKPYFLFVAKMGDGRYGYAWASRIGPKTKDYLVKKVREGTGAIVTTTDLYWSNGGVTLKPFGPVSLPRDETRRAELQALFEGGNPAYSLALIRAPKDDPRALGALPPDPRALGSAAGRMRRKA